MIILRLIRISPVCIIVQLTTDWLLTLGSMSHPLLALQLKKGTWEAKGERKEWGEIGIKIDTDGRPQPRCLLETALLSGGEPLAVLPSTDIQPGSRRRLRWITGSLTKYFLGAQWRTEYESKHKQRALRQQDNSTSEITIRKIWKALTISICFIIHLFFWHTKWQTCSTGILKQLPLFTPD